MFACTHCTCTPQSSPHSLFVLCPNKGHNCEVRHRKRSQKNSSNQKKGFCFVLVKQMGYSSGVFVVGCLLFFLGGGGGWSLPTKFVVLWGLFGKSWNLIILNTCYSHLHLWCKFLAELTNFDAAAWACVCMNVCGSLSWAGFAEVHNVTRAACVVAWWMVVKFCQGTEVHIATCTVFCRVLVDGCVRGSFDWSPHCNLHSLLSCSCRWLC